MPQEVDKLIQAHKKRSRRQKVFTSIRKTIDIASSIASTLLLVRDKPKTLDYFSIGMTLANMGLRIHDEISNLNISDPRSFFNGAEHYNLPYTLEKTAHSFVRKQEVLLTSDKTSLMRGMLGDYEIFWIDKDGIKEKPYCRHEDTEPIISTIGHYLWEQNGGRNIMLDKTGFLIHSDESLSFEVIETNAMKELEERLRKFKNDDTPRSYLLEGPPGTGKSSAAMYLIKKLGLRSLRTSLTSVYGGDWQEQGNASANLDVLLRALHPDLIIVDDIDRAHMGDQQMLKLFETARKYCKIIMATCNNKNSMIGAMLRVGRFDDHIEINHLDPEVVMEMLDEEDYDLADRLAKWPIAYIQNYKTVKKVMGQKQARAELDDMEARIFEIERKTMKESGWRFHGPWEEEEEEERPKKQKTSKKKKKKKKSTKTKSTKRKKK